MAFFRKPLVSFRKGTSTRPGTTTMSTTAIPPPGSPPPSTNTATRSAPPSRGSALCLLDLPAAELAGRLAQLRAHEEARARTGATGYKYAAEAGSLPAEEKEGRGVPRWLVEAAVAGEGELKEPHLSMLAAEEKEEEVWPRPLLEGCNGGGGGGGGGTLTLVAERAVPVPWKEMDVDGSQGGEGGEWYGGGVEEEVMMVSELGANLEGRDLVRLAREKRTMNIRA